MFNEATIRMPRIVTSSHPSHYGYQGQPAGLTELSFELRQRSGTAGLRAVSQPVLGQTANKLCPPPPPSQVLPAQIRASTALTTTCSERTYGLCGLPREDRARQAPAPLRRKGVAGDLGRGGGHQGRGGRAGGPTVGWEGARVRGRLGLAAPSEKGPAKSLLPRHLVCRGRSLACRQKPKPLGERRKEMWGRVVLKVDSDCLGRSLVEAWVLA